MAFLVLDESERDEFLAVGGLIVPTGLVYDLEAWWRTLKANYGLPAVLPLKWTPEGESAQTLRERGIDINDIRRGVCRRLSSYNNIVALAIVLQERRQGRLRPGRGGVRDFYATGVAFSVQRFAKVLDVDPRFADKPHLIVLDNIAWSRGRRSPLWANKVTRSIAKLRWGGQKRSIVPWMESGHKALLQSYSDWHMRGFPDVGITTPLEQGGFLSSFVEAHGEEMDVLQVADFICGCAVELFFSVAIGRLSAVARHCVKTLMPVFCQASGFGSGVWGDGIVLYPSNLELWRKVREEVE